MKKAILFFASWVLAFGLNAQIYQLPNPGFEDWDGSTLSGSDASEPSHWNTFSSADGSVATSWLTGSTAKNNHHAHRYGGRPGSTGSSYITIWSKSVLGVVANGNITTGRIHIGSTTASNLEENYNYTSRSENGFNQAFDGTPDSMYVWVSYYAASTSSQGSISCYIHGNNNFKDPTGADNNSLYCGRAKAVFSRTDNTAGGGNVWQQVKVPFIYDGTAPAKYILLTCNTNTTPGGGSANDSLSVDDIEFIYSAWLNEISVNGLALEGFDKGVFDYVIDAAENMQSIQIDYVKEVEDAMVDIDSMVFENDLGQGVCYLLHVVAEDGITTNDYKIWCYFNSGLKDINGQTEIHISPNPADNQVIISSNEPLGEVVLLNAAGQEVFQGKYPQSQVFLNISHLPRGVYICKIRNTKGEFRRKLIKQ